MTKKRELIYRKQLIEISMAIGVLIELSMQQKMSKEQLNKLREFIDETKLFAEEIQQWNE